MHEGHASLRAWCWHAQLLWEDHTKDSNNDAEWTWYGKWDRGEAGGG